MRSDILNAPTISALPPLDLATFWSLLKNKNTAGRFRREFEQCKIKLHPLFQTESSEVSFKPELQATLLECVHERRAN